MQGISCKKDRRAGRWKDAWPAFSGTKNGQAACEQRGKGRLIRRPMCKKDRRATRKHMGSADLFCNYHKKHFAKHRQVERKTSAFLPRFDTRKDPVFSDRVLVCWLAGFTGESLHYLHSFWESDFGSFFIAPYFPSNATSDFARHPSSLLSRIRYFVQNQSIARKRICFIS